MAAGRFDRGTSKVRRTGRVAALMLAALLPVGATVLPETSRGADGPSIITSYVSKVAAIGVTTSPAGGGWVAFANGAVEPFGGAVSYGSLVADRLAEPIVGVASTPSGHGYWLVASDGGIFAFGDARFYGSTGGVRLDRPVVGMASTPSGHGYWLVASDGGIFAFGDARFYGSTGGVRLDRPVVGIGPAPGGSGYLLVAADGGVFTFGSSRFAGSLSQSGQWIAGIAPADGGYYVVTTTGQVVSFGLSKKVDTASTSPAQLLSAALSGQVKLFGVSPEGNSAGIASLPALAAELNHPVDVVNIFMGWNQPLPVKSLQAIAAEGSIPELTWEPWPAGGGPDQPAYADSVISSGTYDSYIESVAAEAKAWGGPILLRYGHEMNGTWYPWAASVNGNTPAAFVAAWRHVHDRFAAAGATNVLWVWCPNNGGPTPVSQVYPGGGYVDIVGMDGYDWGNGTTGDQSPTSMFGSILSQVEAIAPAKPVLINETGTTGAAGNETTWMEQLFAYVAAQSQLVGVVYSDFGNWMLDDSPQAIAGAKAGLTSLTG